MIVNQQTGEQGVPGVPGTAEGAVKGVAEANLKMIRGEIEGATGAVVRGEGFTAVRTAEGLYEITPTVPFLTIPTATVVAQNAVNVRQAQLNGPPAVGLIKVRVTTAAGANADGNIDFTIVGPHA